MDPLDDLYDALSTLERAIGRLKNHGDWDFAQEAERTLQQGRTAYGTLSRKWPEAKAALEASRRAYDRYVTSAEREE